MNRFSSLSRGTKVVLVLGIILLLGALTGLLRADRGINVTKEEAIRIAEEQVTFQPETTVVRLVRQGFRSQAFWAVSLSVPAPDGGFVRLTTVLVDVGTGEVREVRHQRPPQG